jgi:hypothetical protein
MHCNIAKGRILRCRRADFCRMDSGCLLIKRPRAWDGTQKEIADWRVKFGTSATGECRLNPGTFSRTTRLLSSSIALAQEAP